MDILIFISVEKLITCYFSTVSLLQLLFILILKILLELFFKLLSFYPCPSICSVLRVTNRANNLLRIRIILQRLAEADRLRILPNRTQAESGGLDPI